MDIMSKRILVVDDEPDIMELVRFNLSQEGFEVDTAENGANALAQIGRRPPDLVILDLMLPDLSGADVCRKLRSMPETSKLPVIMLTARSEEVDRVVGFELGADDYVTKPFSPRELVLRVKAVLRRGVLPESVTRRFEHGPLQLDQEGHRCLLDGDELELTAKEFRLLAALMARPGRVWSREQLLDDVWGSDIAVTHRTVDTHVKRLREKLGAAGDLIHTVRGVGYRFAD
jgi:two-component system phosphate regulon response regulator PhoB